MMIIASWNVNSIRTRLSHVQDLLREFAPDVLGLQELKVDEERFPYDAVQSMGYHALVHGQRTYNGVALLSSRPGTEPRQGLRQFEDSQSRLIAATFDGIRVINVYVPNGQSVGSDKYEYKLRWLDALIDDVRHELGTYERLVLMGDFNIAPEDRDVHDPETWHEKVLCSTPERERFRQLAALGLQDTFRLFPQPEASFSWWDYRAAAFRRGMGLRIDLILASEALAAECTSSGIEIGPRRLERPSDHTPAWARFAPRDPVS